MKFTPFHKQISYGQAEYKNAVAYLTVLYPNFPLSTVMIVLAVVFSMAWYDEIKKA